jgi:RNA 3'-phosphate cyclase
MIHIDGAHAEGGGQVFRTALALSALTGTPFRAERIRENRPRPGLKAQHLSCIDALARMSRARAEGAGAGSAAVVFHPGRLRGGTHAIDIGTAGSVTLLLQALLLPAMFAAVETRLRIKGGTDTRWSIPLDYCTRLVLPLYAQFAGIEILDRQRGFYPRGQGHLELRIRPRAVPPRAGPGEDFLSALRPRLRRLDLATRLEPTRIEGVSAASIHLAAARVAERQAESAAAALGGALPVDIRTQYGRAASPGSVITLWAVDSAGRALLGADALGERGKPAEAVGRQAAGRLAQVLGSGAVVDAHLADNLIGLLALCGGALKTESITGHIRSGIYVCERFLGVRFDVDEAGGRVGVDP